jgi:RNA polymerase sigma factor (TIGR02999 family)
MEKTGPHSDESGTVNLTRLLQRMQAGDRGAGEKAAGLVYDELHRIAAKAIARERADHLLQTTALIHEAYLHLLGSQPLEIQSRGHFYAIASQQMRRILIDFARARDAKRRGSGLVNFSLNDVEAGFSPRDINLLLLDESLSELQRIDARAAKVVEMRFFGGYSDKEVVEALGVSLASVRRDWDYARAWLFDRMKGTGHKAASV